MSGGHWDYNQDRIGEMLRAVGQDWDVHTRWSKTAFALRQLATFLEEEIGDMDWDISGDSPIEDDKRFDQDFADALTGFAITVQNHKNNPEVVPQKEGK